MFKKILIANRGEIALRVLRACRTLGIEAVVAYSEADRESLPVQLADEAICIGPADARRSYLSAPAFVEIGHRVKKDQVLCIIEAMKLMNEITSEYDGEIVSAYVENGKPVQYGERLFAIKTA